jgi:hypothetical protein
MASISPVLKTKKCVAFNEILKPSLAQIPIYLFWGKIEIIREVIQQFFKKFFLYAAVVQRKFRFFDFVGDVHLCVYFRIGLLLVDSVPLTKGFDPFFFVSHVNNDDWITNELKPECFEQKRYLQDHDWRPPFKKMPQRINDYFLENGAVGDSVEHSLFFLGSKNDLAQFWPVKFPIWEQKVLSKDFKNLIVGWLSWPHDIP